MSSSCTVEAAHRFSRSRALIWGLLGCSLLVTAGLELRHPWAGQVVDPDRAEFWFTRIFWLVEVSVVLLVIATGGALLAARRVRILMNDEITQRNRAQALAAGFWTAMAAGVALSAVDAFRPLAAGCAIVVIVSVALAASLLAFARFELRDSKS